MYTLRNLTHFQPLSSVFPKQSSFIRIANTRPTSSTRYRPASIDNIEDIEGYRSGGFHPIRLTDTLENGRYRILHKLGYGGSSTLWLARDIQLQRLVSLKIIMSEASRNCNELNILSHLKIARTEERQMSDHSILDPLDIFSVNGPNGSHVCLVSQFAGPSLSQISFSPGRPAGCRRLRGELARKVAAQLSLAVDHLNSLGVVHGDLTASNILLQLSDQTEYWSDQDIYEEFGHPITHKVHATAQGEDVSRSAPPYLVEPLQFSDLRHKYFSEKMLLIDFGQSFLLRSPPVEGVGTPIAYRSPEAIFERKEDVKSDIWALGSAIFETRAGTQLFASFFGGPDEILREMVQTLGRLPEPWWSSWEKRHLYFDDCGKPKTSWVNNITLAVEYPLMQQVMDIGAEDDQLCPEGDEAVTSPSMSDEKSIFEPLGTRLAENEVHLLEDLIKKVVKYNPDERLPIKEIISHPWFPKEYKGRE